MKKKLPKLVYGKTGEPMRKVTILAVESILELYKELLENSPEIKPVNEFTWEEYSTIKTSKAELEKLK